MAKDAQETANQQAATEAEQPEEATADNQQTAPEQAAPEQAAVPEEQFSAGR